MLARAPIKSCRLDRLNYSQLGSARSSKPRIPAELGQSCHAGLEIKAGHTLAVGLSRKYLTPFGLKS